jgi:hypothetical protein
LTLSRHCVAGNSLPPDRRGRDELNGHSVYNPVDDLCRKTLSLCASQERLGIFAAHQSQNASAACINSIHILWKGKKRKLSTSHAEKSPE